ncbi:MAG: mannose-1-phosphate guanylyltransferase [Planctomycetota bacterium]
MLHAIVMAGGSGTRFWPASRHQRPKQLLPLAGPRTMIQATCDRLQSLVAAERTHVITARHLVQAIANQLPQLPPENIVGEPCRRDTAPCVGLAAAIVAADDPEGVMLVCPADHVIHDHDAFAKAAHLGQDTLENHPDAIITFGIRPTYPAESFGYIESGEAVRESEVLNVQQFREKPDAETAQSYVRAGTFYWNSGIFMWRAATILEALGKHEPIMHDHLQTIAASIGTRSFASTLENEFKSIEGKSIDYAVMERHERVLVIPAPFDWDDVGSWQAVSRLHPTDDVGNVAVGTHVNIDSRGCIVHGDPDHVIVTIDTEDLIVVQTGDATLVAPKRSEERVREAVAELKRRGLTERI